MCGISGQIGGNPETRRQNVATMMQSMHRRGPDSAGQHDWPAASFGHRRLAILDLSPGGYQPMLSEDGQIGVVFNGCIYNFLELRNELEALGHRFRSQCDTEVLLRGYIQWGADALTPRLRGMFAFAVWDERSQELALVRDRMGVKPLVYAIQNGALAFGSTINALREIGLVRDIDPQGVLEFIEYGYVTDERSIYRGAHKLAPGTVLRFRGGKVVSTKTYWSLPEIEEDSKIRFEEAVEETERLLIEAVRLRLQADVPIAALLSGGIDSTLICWAMTKLNANVKAFTVGTSGDALDESAAAREIAQTLGIPHEIIHLSPAESAPMDELLDAYSEPFAPESALGILSVSKTIKPLATVLLTGDGGDDVFLGYSFFQTAYRAQRLARQLPGFAPSAYRQIRPLLRQLPMLKRGASFLDQATGGLGDYARLHNGLPYLTQRGVPGRELRNLKLAQREMPASLSSSRNLLSDVFRFHWRMHFTGEFMTKVDGGTMYSALEARSPLLDHTLWDFAAKLPAHIRFHNGELKAILRQIVRQRVAPSIAARPKQGFSVPIDRWLSDPRWLDKWQSLGANSRLIEGGWVDGEALRQTIGGALKQNRVPVQLWNLLVLDHWLERWA